MSHIRGSAQFDQAVIGHKVKHVDLVDYLAPRDPASYPHGTWRTLYRGLALDL